MKNFLFSTELWLPRPREAVFPFFADARNLETITPPWLRFETLTPGPIEMRPGARIDYRLRVHGLPIRWQTEITEWQPPHRFVDQQLRGPYHLWHHTHTFRDVSGGTEMTDVVNYAVGFGPLGELAHVLFVERTLARIFDYRAEVIAKQFGATEVAATHDGLAAAT